LAGATFFEKNIQRAVASAANVGASSTKMASIFKTGFSSSSSSSSSFEESALGGSSAVYLEQMYQEYKENPSNVHASWRHYFDNLEAGSAPAFSVPPTLGALDAKHFPRVASSSSTSPGFSQSSSTSASSTQDIQDALRLWSLERSYRVRGHHAAKLDPLEREPRFDLPRELDYTFHGFKESDLDRPIFSERSANQRETLREALDRLRATYCASIGLEFMHIQSQPQVDWLREKMEEWAASRKTITPREVILTRLMWADKFERFLEIKYSGAKRFGLEGCEATIPFLKSLIDRSADLGVEDMVFGMPHRGRLNFLANVVRKPMENIFGEFHGAPKGKRSDTDSDYVGSGDVKYHLGTSYDRLTRSGKQVHLSLVANPSHLEAVNPVVEGKVRAKQHYRKDKDRKASMSVLMHGDAAFAGQGVVYETLHFSDLSQYTTGGTVHLIVNNQIGFTTDPYHSRSTPYPTDVAKSLGAPIFHVNGDDVDACVFAAEMAAEFRQKFGKTVVVDLVGYRKHGHNESDAPDMTQPIMYSLIRKKKSVLNVYTKRLEQEGVVSKQRIEEETKEIADVLQERFEKSKQEDSKIDQWLESHWKGFKSPGQKAKIKTTGVSLDLLKFVGEHVTKIPEGFTPHKVVGRVFKKRAEMIKSGEKLDWAMAEALAFGTLLLEGNHVRISGQDVERGTFSHRHAAIHDNKTGEKYYPIRSLEQHTPDSSANFSCYNSSLSEFGVLGFELGYSMENPNSLVIWEAQFGDFANGAQVIFDQFLAPGEAKWLRQCGLVCLLPHGYDGQGPEHSSARLERFLQLTDSDPTVFEKSETDFDVENQIQRHNMQVVNVTTPANYFHVLRRQIHREFRKPLIVMSPKNLLRHPECTSSLSEFDDVSEHSVGFEHADTFFQRVIGEQNPDDTLVPPEKIKRVVYCSGKVYYNLLAHRRKHEINDVALVRIEQLAPFPFEPVAQHARHYPNAELSWCQEEPMNMGAWTFIAPHIKSAVSHDRPDAKVSYFGRVPASSPASGYAQVHEQEQDKLCNDALSA